MDFIGEAVLFAIVVFCLWSSVCLLLQEDPWKLWQDHCLHILGRFTECCTVAAGATKPRL